MVGAHFRDVTCQLRDFDLLLHILLDACKQHFALAWLPSIDLREDEGRKTTKKKKEREGDEKSVLTLNSSRNIDMKEACTTHIQKQRIRHRQR